MSRAFEYLGRHLPVDELVLSLFDRDDAVLRTVALLNAEQTVLLFDEPDVLTVPQETAAQLADPALPSVRRVDEAGPRTRIDKLGARRDGPDSSLMTVRLWLHGGQIGTLIVHASGTGRYTAEHERRLSLLEQPLSVAIANALDHQTLIDTNERLVAERRELQGRFTRPSTVGQLIGAEQGLQTVMAKVHLVALTSRPVLLLGEVGVGKATLAAALHALSDRRDGPFVRVSCVSLTKQLAESELFGHEPGAFMGAVSRRLGSVELASHGTLFLEEVDELAPSVQTRILRTLQKGELTRLGSSQPIRVDLRVVASSRVALEELIEVGAFRPDLWATLDLLPIRIPPLRDRREDIPELALHLARREAQQLGRAAPIIRSSVLAQLKAYDWPGNARELRAVIERALMTTRAPELTFENLHIGTDSAPAAEVSSASAREDPAQPTPGTVFAPTQDGPLESLDAVIARHLESALAAAHGRIEGSEGAAAALGLNPSTLRHRLRKLHIPFGRSN